MRDCWFGFGFEIAGVPRAILQAFSLLYLSLSFQNCSSFHKTWFSSLKKRLDNQWTTSEIFACCCCEWKLVVGGAGGAPEYLATFHLLFMRGDASVTWPRVVLARENKMAETPCGKTCFSIFQRKCRSCRSVSDPFTNYINAVSKCPVQKGL